MLQKSNCLDGDLSLFVRVLNLSAVSMSKRFDCVGARRSREDTLGSLGMNKSVALIEANLAFEAVLEFAAEVEALFVF